MRKREPWPIAGFLTVGILGTLCHFAYEWSGKKALVGAFCAVNESTWEHMKLLFFPALLFTLVQLLAHGLGEGGLWARSVSITAGLGLIPILFYTYAGVLGSKVSWVNILIFYLADAAVFCLEGRLSRRGRPWRQAAGLIWLWVLAFLFVWWTFAPPHLGLWLDPVTGTYGIP